jgi:hypothetical protein
VKLEICYILRGRGMTQMVWKPRIMVPSHQIMAKTILQAGLELARSRELLANALPGEDLVGSRSIFPIASISLDLVEF